MKSINKIMTQNEIYQIALSFLNNFNNDDVRMPAAIGYAIQKNKNTLMAFAQEIEQNRLNILNHYGEQTEENQYYIQPENIDIVNKEFQNLLAIEEEVKIYTIKIEELENLMFTSAQINALMFMIEEE